MMWLALALLAADPCVEVAGDRITAADLAVRIPALAAAPPSASIGYAPKPGVRRVLRAAELREFAKTLGLEGPEGGEVCVVRAMRVLEPQLLEAAMRKTLPADLSTFRLTSWSRFPIPEGEVVFPPEGIRPTGKGLEVLWSGYVRYGEGDRFRVWARAEIGRMVGRVVATAPIRSGSVIAPGQVREEQFEVAIGAPEPLRLSQVVGQTARRSLASGAIADRLSVEPPLDVRRGEAVTVRSRVGRASVSVEMVAQTSGRAGQSVYLLNAGNGRKVRAVISGPGEARTGERQEISNE